MAGVVAAEAVADAAALGAAPAAAVVAGEIEEEKGAVRGGALSHLVDFGPCQQLDAGVKSALGRSVQAQLPVEIGGFLGHRAKDTVGLRGVFRLNMIADLGLEV